ASLRQVLRAVLALRAPDGDVEVVRLLGPLPRRVVLPARVDGDPQAANGHAGRGVAELGVTRQVPDEYDPVDVRHGVLAPLLKTRSRLLRRRVGVIGGWGPGRCGRRSR